MSSQDGYGSGEGGYGQGDSPYHVTYPMMHVMYLPPPVDRTTDRHIPVKTLSSHNMPTTFSFPSCTIKGTGDKGCLHCCYYWICAQIFTDKHFATNCFQLSNLCLLRTRLYNQIQCSPVRMNINSQCTSRSISWQEGPLLFFCALKWPLIFFSITVACLLKW